MKTKGHPKEKLTYANIRRDLRRRLWTSWLWLILIVLMTVGLIWAFHQMPALLFRSSGRMPGWLYLLLLPYLLYVMAKKAWLVSCGFRRKPYIVKDKLASSEGDDSMYATHRYRTAWCTLHFNCYGDYDVPQKNYSWSKENATTAKGIYNLAFEGGEYYLVLSKPHSGKILLAYNAELFELEDE